MEKPKPWLLALLVVAIGLLAFNQWQLSSVSGKVTALAAAPGPSVRGTTQAPTTGNALQAAIDAVLPRGQPWWGTELGVSFDQPLPMLDVLNRYDDIQGSNGRGSKPISLSAELQQRYITIGSSISCEYCCGAPTMVFRDGSPACGCAHSGAMRGLAKYLLSKYPERSDQEILGEVAKVKAISFPQQTVAKYLESQSAAQPAQLSQLQSQVGGC